MKYGLIHWKKLKTILKIIRNHPRMIKITILNLLVYEYVLSNKTIIKKNLK